jgi:ATP-dependent Lhr-like helicase
VRDADELCELLVELVAVRPGDLPEGLAPLARMLVAEGRAAQAVAPDDTPLLFAVERLSDVRALLPGGAVAPGLELPEHLRREPIGYEQALDEAVRGHLAVLGPTTQAVLARRLGSRGTAVAASLARLESRGILLRGHFDADLPAEQVCDRGLLARIHRYTIARLRREIEPIPARDYWRFLVRWQHVHPETRLAGERGLLAAIEQLAGYESPVAVWEDELLAARVDGYRRELLDSLCLSGEVAWGRLAPRAGDGRGQPSRAMPISLFPRAELDPLLHAARAAHANGEASLREPAARVLELLKRRGALFAREIESASGLPAVQVEEGLRELVARGLATCDGFAPLRRLLGRPGSGSRRRARVDRATPPDREDAAELTARRLLRRYGVVFRDALVREWIPEGWIEVHRALRRLEARGLVRGGRFVTGFVGEQFALPEAVDALRRERKRARGELELRVSAADPLNLAGVLTPGPRVPAGHRRAVILCDGLPVATVERGRRLDMPDPLSSGRVAPAP